MTNVHFFGRPKQTNQTDSGKRERGLAYQPPCFGDRIIEGLNRMAEEMDPDGL